MTRCQDSDPFFSLISFWVSLPSHVYELWSCRNSKIQYFDYLILMYTTFFVCNSHKWFRLDQTRICWGKQNHLTLPSRSSKQARKSKAYWSSISGRIQKIQLAQFPRKKNHQLTQFPRKKNQCWKLQQILKCPNKMHTKLMKSCRVHDFVHASNISSSNSNGKNTKLHKVVSSFRCPTDLKVKIIKTVMNAQS